MDGWVGGHVGEWVGECVSPYILNSLWVDEVESGRVQGPYGRVEVRRA